MLSDLDMLGLEIIKCIDRVGKNECSCRDRLPLMFERYLSNYGGPIIARDKVVFVYRGEAGSVHVVGDWNHWSINPSDAMVRANGEYWFLVKKLPVDARVEYKFVVDDSWITDPFNPRIIMEGFGPNSELLMPGHVVPPWYDVPDDAPKGRVEELVVSDCSGRPHRVVLYTPPIDKRPIATLYFYDGDDYLLLGRANRVLDYMVASRDIPPINAVFVSPSSREERVREYGDRPIELAKFLVGRVIPHIESRGHPTGKTRVLVGDSLAGLAATITLLEYTALFDVVFAQSPAYWYGLGLLGELLSGKRDLRGKWFLIHYGLFEAEYIEPVLGQVIDKLLAAGASVSVEKNSQGHNWGHWREDLGYMLIEYFGKRA